MDIFFKELHTTQTVISQEVDGIKPELACFFNHRTANGCRN